MTTADPHGFLLLMSDGGNPARRRDFANALRDAGFAFWDGNGRPLFVIIDGGVAKHCWFQAGLYAGLRVPLFLVGQARVRKRHQEVVSASGGWTCEAGTVGQLLAAVTRRGLRPSAWDAETLAAAPEREVANG